MTTCDKCKRTSDVVDMTHCPFCNRTDDSVERLLEDEALKQAYLIDLQNQEWMSGFTFKDYLQFRHFLTIFKDQCVREVLVELHKRATLKIAEHARENSPIDVTQMEVIQVFARENDIDL